MKSCIAIKIKKYFIFIFLALPISCFACPGCSMFNLFTAFRKSGDGKCAAAIVLGIIAVPIFEIRL